MPTDPQRCETCRFVHNRPGLRPVMDYPSLVGPFQWFRWEASDV